MKKQGTSAGGSDLEGVLKVLRRRGWLVALVFLLVAGSALGLSLSQQKQYSATASLLFRDPGFDQKLFGASALPPSTDPAREAATNVQLVSLRTVADRTARRLSGPLDGQEISNKISVAPAGQSDVVGITATDHDPKFASQLANNFGQDYIAFRRDADRAKIREAQALVQRQLAGLSQDATSAQRRSLQGQAEQLRLLASLQTGNAELVQPADVPTSPSSPQTVRNTIVGAVLGLILGLGLAFLFERLDRSLKEPEELEELYNLPVLAVVPESRALATAAGGREAAALPAAEAETFRMLRARMRYFNVDRPIRSLLLTSSASQEGKSTVTWHLAAAAATSGKAKVLILETDLRRPSLARDHGLVSMPGLAEALTHDIALDEVIQHVPIGPKASGRDQPTLDVIVAGGRPPNPTELIESEHMSEQLKTLEQRYDLVLIDTTPMSMVSDGIPLMKQVSGVIVVSRLRKTTRDAARRLANQLRTFDAPVLGVVANRVKVRRGGTYSYDYSYGVRPEEERPSAASRGNVASTNGHREETPARR